MVLGLATGTKKGSSALSDLVTSYASILASQVGGGGALFVLVARWREMCCV